MPKINKTDLNWFLNNLFRNGLMFYKRVGQYGQNSGAISVPRHMVGKIVKVILIPLNAEEEYFVDPKELRKKINLDMEKVERELLLKRMKRIERRLNELDPNLVNSELEKMKEIEDSIEKHDNIATRDYSKIKKIDTERKE